MASTKKKDPESDNNFPYKTLKALGKLMNEVGIPGFIVIVLVTIFFEFATDAQKIEFIDKWFLGKSITAERIIILLLLLALTFNFYFCRKNSKIDAKRIEQMSETKTLLQEGKIGKELSSSQKSKT